MPSAAAAGEGRGDLPALVGKDLAEIRRLWWRCGWPDESRGETRVVSTASWTPPHAGRPLAMTSMRLSSWRATWTLRSRSRTLVATVAPASDRLERQPVQEVRPVHANGLTGGMQRDGPRKHRAVAGNDKWRSRGGGGDAGAEAK